MGVGVRWCRDVGTNKALDIASGFLSESFVDDFLALVEAVKSFV